jgi:hypothetical protein
MAVVYQEGEEGETRYRRPGVRPDDADITVCVRKHCPLPPEYAM